MGGQEMMRVAAALIAIAAIALSCPRGWAEEGRPVTETKAAEPGAAKPKVDLDWREFSKTTPPPKHCVGGDLWTWSTLSGDWGGLRSDLAEKGFTLEYGYSQTLHAPEPLGGAQTLYLSQPTTGLLEDDKVVQDAEQPVAGTTPAEGEPGGGTEALAKAAQNPIASMISVPFQNNMNFGVGRRDKMQNILNIQPVIPVTLSEDWNLITRTILPIVWQPELAPHVGPEAGLGDVQLSLFLSPAKAKGFIWGVGPALQFPSATDPVLGAGKFSAGPNFVGLVIDGPWVYGALMQNVWSYAGPSNRGRVNQFLLQPFVNYNFKGGIYLTTSPVITADWVADSDNRWTVPLGGGVGQIFRIGKLPVNVSVAGYYNVVTPDNGPEWQLRLQAQFLFPR